MLDCTDSASYYLQKCRGFFDSIHHATALYCIDTQLMELALKQGNVALARERLKHAVKYENVEPNMIHVRNRYLQRYFEKVGDYERAYHFLEENERVINQINALKNDDINAYIKLMNESGLSSFMYLQNCYSVTSSKNMGVALAICLTKDFLKGEGACRVHGGGFAGTIQALIPLEKAEEYKKYMNSIFGEGSAVKIRVRQAPVCEIK